MNTHRRIARDELAALPPPEVLNGDGKRVQATAG
jgi:hypothetical protein